MRAEAFAKINLSLRVSSPGPDGYHPLHSLFQTIGWSDAIDLDDSDDDTFEVEGDAPDDESNLAWRALAAVREDLAGPRPLRLRLHKRIPVAAGLGGGSSDAAAVLQLASRRLGGDPDLPGRLAFALGADVPFFLTGGFALVEGYGERVERMGDGGGYAVAVAVPPFELNTGDVFATWDRLGQPAGEPLDPGAVPPVLRGYEPLANDLFPAAVHLAPELGDWRSDLEQAWGRAVAMSGSGPALFGFFVDEDEARGAVGHVPSGARATRAAAPTPRGSSLDETTLT